MFNPQKVRLMTRISSYEKKNKKKLDNLSYFKSDYVGFNTFLVCLGVSISLALFFLADLALRFMYDTKALLETDIASLFTKYLIIWIIFMVFYAVFSSIIYRKKYNESSEVGERLERMLKKLRNY